MSKLMKVGAFALASFVTVVIGLAILNRVGNRVPLLRTIIGEA